jgi:S-formylglutathione hydrolase
MAKSRVELGKVSVKFGPQAAPYAAVLPPGYEQGGPYPLCLMLHGGGGSHQNLVDTQAAFDQWWEAGIIPPMVIASASTGPMSFYFDSPDGKVRWESFIAEDFLAHLRDKYKVRRDRASTVITGASMGGYGCLKIAFKHPEPFAAVAALEPAVEPGLRDADVGARNRFFYPAEGGGVGGPDELMGPNRDPALFESNNPANRARANADAIRNSGIAIYLEAGDEDLLNLHDGAEFLHRVLWDLDIAHEYHMVRGADHVGPSLGPRMREAFTFLASVLAPVKETGDEQPTPKERAFVEWMNGGFKGEPPPMDATSKLMIPVLRAQFEPARQRAAKVDPNMRRRYGILPPTK